MTLNELLHSAYFPTQVQVSRSDREIPALA